MPEIERRLIINLYWRQHASVRWNGETSPEKRRAEKSREVKMERGVRQACIISPLLFNLYSEFMMKEVMEGMEGINFNEINIADIRYADDAVLVADKRKKMQKMVDSLNDICRSDGMEINVKKTKVMIMGIKEKNGVRNAGQYAFGTSDSFQKSR